MWYENEVIWDNLRDYACNGMDSVAKHVVCSDIKFVMHRAKLWNYQAPIGAVREIMDLFGNVLGLNPDTIKKILSDGYQEEKVIEED